MPVTYCSKATHAIIGSHPDAGAGILNWYDEEFSAYKDSKNFNLTGGTTRVVKTPNGNIESLQKEILNLIFE